MGDIVIKMATLNSGEGKARHDDALTREMEEELKRVGLESGIMILKSCDSVEELLRKLDDYFKLLNTTYRKLSSMDGRNHTKSVSIIQAVSACQICVRMLDFELHNTIFEMFELFLDGIQLNHPQEIFSSLEHIMTLIIQYIEESDEFVVELTKIFLVALKKGNKNISPCALQLTRKVFEKCADIMHNSVPEAVTHMGDAVQEYDDVIVSSFLGATQSDNMSCCHKKMATPNSGEGDVRCDDALTKEMEEELKRVVLEYGNMNLKSGDPVEELWWKLDDYFKLLNTTFRKLSSMDGRNHAKSVSIIHAVSARQTCARMLDFELHNTIFEMFELFLDGIQLNYPQEIFSSMEHIMTLIIQYIEESDEFMVELTKIFLVALKKGNKNISPCAFQLTRKVFEKCADIMHNSVPEAVRHMGDAVQEYDDVIVSSFLDATPSNDMDYFKLLNTTFRKLSSMDGRNHTKSVSIIQAVSACQICVRMLDFELHNTILEILHLFLDEIQTFHHVPFN
ncbi:uncharacterized protein [Primulina huaijiensis]|uniref:uncharacterized protein n=1 Tax=Primulina huaijiensis TaxID=1492673 RepID=UPI003CC73FAE